MGLVLFREQAPFLASLARVAADVGFLEIKVLPWSWGYSHDWTALWLICY